MAGIGFELRRLVHGSSGLLGKSWAYACAGLISSGPWILTVLTLLLVNFSGSGLVEDDARNFRALVTYAFAFSLLTVGTVQMALTRHVSDLLYAGRHEAVLPTFAAAVRVVGPFQLVTGAAFCQVADFDARTAYAWTALYVVVSLIWLAVSWLTIIRQYGQILIAFLAGMATSVISIEAMASGVGVAGSIAAYAAGQALTLALLIRLIQRGTAQADDATPGGVRAALTRYPMLIGVGLFYSVGMWVDKMVFWYADGMGSHPLIRFHPLYDTSCFLAYLTVVPALAINLVHLETSFYEHYRGYYAAIMQNMPLREIEWRRQEMTENLREGTARLLRLQGAVTFAAIVFAPQIMELLGVPPGAVKVFRVACLGAFFHIGFLITTLLLLYFDLRRDAMLSCATFFALNLLLTLATVKLGFEFYGFGYTLAALIALVQAFACLSRNLYELEYQTFTLHATKVPGTSVPTTVTKS